jgi:hypothetical protein
MAKRNLQFQTIRTEGAILPPDILRRIASLKVDGATPDAYHLSPGMKLNEAISQSWTSLLNHWQAFQEAREKLSAEGETGTAVTNERWLLPLFNELDYGRLVTTKSPVIEERSYPIERFYNHTPIHLIGCKLPLDRRTKGARGAATASPHSMVQEFLNQSDEHVWAFLSNGLQLRILRDNVSLSRQTFVEFDLEAMMEGEVYADFALLWLLCHQSRVESDKPEDCWLEKWSKLAREQGTRVLNDLRVGVGNAIEALGRGFIGHPRNDHLREKFHSGTLTKDEFYRQLLRIVYRLLFLFVAEDRELLHPPLPEGDSRDEEQKARNLYDDYYSTRRLRELALKMRGTKHADLWHSLSLVFDALSDNDGCPELGLCGLGSFLWRASSTGDLLGPHQAHRGIEDAVLITNDDLLQAVRALAYVEQDRVLRMVDYRNLGSEELGSVYESLLELHPVMDVEGKSFNLMTAAGNERKTTGSYYTPDSLVQCLLDSALDPVVEDRLKGKKGEEAAKAILEIKVCDPASGSGHFLIAAAHRLARHLARVRTGEAEPSPDDYQHALRDVIGRCLYGVDINPMAVELCKVSLWMEAIEPGKPLSFLDHHIQCGNSLLGTTPALLAKGIPDDAFEPIEGDEKSVCSDLKKTNKRERSDYASGQGYLFSPTLKLGNLPATLAKLNKGDDGTLSDVSAKEKLYAELVKGADYCNARLLADTWCTAFVWKKDNSDLGRLCPTERNYRSIEDNPHSINIHVKADVERLASQYQFFHWHLAFPDVFPLPHEGQTAENLQSGWNGGFDVVLGNPPWEHTELKEQEWFAERRPEIANATGAKRKKLIESLKLEDPRLFQAFVEEKRTHEAWSHFIRGSSRYPLCARGRTNTYGIFAELNLALIQSFGRVGCIVPTGIATDDTYKFFFQSLIDSNRLVSLFDFENRDALFPGVHRSYKFCLLTASGANGSNVPATLVFFALSVGELNDSARRFQLTGGDIATLNPNSRTCPVFRSVHDAELSKWLFMRNRILVDTNSQKPEDQEWNVTFKQGIYNMTSDSSLFTTLVEVAARSESHNDYGRLYEGRLGHQYNHRFATQDGSEITEVPVSCLSNPSYFVGTQFVVAKAETDLRLARREKECESALLGFRRVSRSTDERTSIATILPWGAASYGWILTFGPPASELLQLLAAYNSFVLDYCLRNALSQPSIPVGTFEQLVVPPRNEVAKHGAFIKKRALELTYTAWDLAAFALDCDYDGPPLRWDEERRFRMRCELDAAYFHLYLGGAEEWGTDSPELLKMFPTPREGVEYIMETFPIVKRRDEQTHGEYRTKRVILEIYDEMAEAIRTGQPYQTRLDPPPGPPTDAEGNFIPMAEWDANNWPSHIHPPRKESEVVK